MIIHVTYVPQFVPTDPKSALVAVRVVRELGLVGLGLASGTWERLRCTTFSAEASLKARPEDRPKPERMTNVCLERGKAPLHSHTQDRLLWFWSVLWSGLEAGLGAEGRAPEELPITSTAR